MKTLYIYINNYLSKVVRCNENVNDIIRKKVREAVDEANGERIMIQCVIC